MQCGDIVEYVSTITNQAGDYTFPIHFTITPQLATAHD